MLHGKTILRGLQAFTFAGFAKPMPAKGGLATCKTTKVPSNTTSVPPGWRSAPEPGLMRCRGLPLAQGDVYAYNTVETNGVTPE